jgi:hypothetical protein
VVVVDPSAFWVPRPFVLLDSPFAAVVVVVLRDPEPAATVVGVVGPGFAAMVVVVVVVEGTWTPQMFA